jgi:glycosyltransferase involved in cell wall biosynthesis
MPAVSVVTITWNEERNIERCLASVRWADDIVVVDSFSTDRTVELARRFTDKVIQHPYEGSTRQMEFGIRHATGEWILFLDADEEVTPALAEEIRRVLGSGSACTGFHLLRRPRAFGRWLEHGGWFPDWQFRLVRRDCYTVRHAEVHGGFSSPEPHGRLEGVVNHYTYANVYAYVARMNDYTSLEVANRLRRRPDARARWYNLLVNPLSAFLRMYISRKGYRDGFHGFVLALLDGTYSLLSYIKLWEYRMREREGGGELPPITNTQLNPIKRSR